MSDARPEPGSEVVSALRVISSSSQMVAGSIFKKSISKVVPLIRIEEGKGDEANDQCKSFKLTLNLDLPDCSLSFSFSAVVGRGFGGVNLLEDCSW